VLAALLVLQIGVLVVDRQRAPTPESMSHNPYRFDELTGFLGSRSASGDRLFVWGWAPEIYSLTRLEAASRLAMCQYVVNDFKAAPDHPSLNPHWAGMLMRDLRERQPRFIVDASSRSWYGTDPWVYDLSHYSDFELVGLLASEYVPIGHVDGCHVYERRAGDSD
jgi:hypothetical protein